VRAAAAAPPAPTTAAAAPAPPAAGRPVSRPTAGIPSRPAPSGSARPAPPTAASGKAAVPESPRVALFDVDGAWSAAATGDANLVVVALADADVRALAQDWPGRVLVNLAAPGAMRALLTLRELHAPTRILGYLANGTADRVLPLGPIEPAALPLEPDAIVAAIARLAPARARVVTVGADVDALLSLRQALARQGTSVSLAWDGKQATELVDMVHPHAVVADLGAPYDAGAVLARLATSSPVPAAVLIDAAADAAGALAMVPNNPEVTEKLVTRADLLRTLAPRAVAKSPAAATLRPAIGSVAGR
jgi:CheY-like chemotaxis protein